MTKSLNSFSLATTHCGPNRDWMIETSSERVFGEKGLFIIPYQQGRKVARITCEVRVLTNENEYLNLWTNPEFGFYGYVHARYFKQSFGNPIQINQRSQVVYEWCPPNVLATLNNSLTANLLGLLVDVIDPGPNYFMDVPLVTDFSFGFQRVGKYAVKVKIWYIDPLYFGQGVLDQISQPLPDPNAVRDTNPLPPRQGGDPDTPISPPYIPDGNDFGESEPGDPITPPPPGGRYRIIWSSRWDYTTDGPPGSYDNVTASGPTIIGPVSSVSPPIFTGPGGPVTFQVTDSEGEKTLFAIQAPTSASIYNQFVDNFEFTLELIP